MSYDGQSTILRHLSRQSVGTYKDYMNHPIVKLEKYEFHNAAYTGFLRQLNSDWRTNTNTFKETYVGQSWYNSIVGACGEAAVAKYLNVYWGAGYDTFNQSDLLGLSCEVRTSPFRVSKPKVKPQDKRMVIAVIASENCKRTFKIWGWLEAEEAKQDEWYYAHNNPCWFPPVTAWKDISTIDKSRLSA